MKPGQALERIVQQVTEINAIIADIAGSAQEQSTGLDQVNTAINQMDQVTQQNAAMVEESTAASRGLAQETENLAQLISHFKTEGNASTRVVPSKHRNGMPSSTPVPGLKTVGLGGDARKAAAAPEDWEEF